MTREAPIVQYCAPAFEGKVCSPPQLLARVQSLPRPLVFTNGVFDLLHRGHVTYLAQARALGASLVVAPQYERSVRRLGQSDDRPLNALADRARCWPHSKLVTLVTCRRGLRRSTLIVSIRPDVLVKAAHWRAEDIVGARK